MIRIAIPIFHHRVSPVLDTCTRLLIIEFEKNVEVDRWEVAVDKYALFERFEMIRKLKLDAVICCGISEEFDRMLQPTEIRVICGIVGEVQQVAEAFLCDRLDAPCFKMPGFQSGGGQ